MIVKVGQRLKFKEFSKHDRQGNYLGTLQFTPGKSYEVIDIYPDHERYGTLLRVISDDRLKTWISVGAFSSPYQRNLPDWF